MAGDQNGTATPNKVKKLATERARLKPLSVIGIFGNEARPVALIRASSGKISRIKVGDKAAGGIVAAIGQDEVVIASRGRTTVLRMPGS